MSTVTIVLRVVSLLALAAPMLLRAHGRQRQPGTRARERAGSRAPVIANFSAIASFFPALLMSSASAAASVAVPLALVGCLLALAGAAVVFRSRTELGSAWSLVPTANPDQGLVTTGPYRLVRHPIYLGLVLIAAGEAVAFGSVPALAIALSAILLTFVWRARAEEALLKRTFGEPYEAYRRRTTMIIPRLI